MNSEILAALVRHFGTVLGGAGLATAGADVVSGTADSSDQLTALISAAMTAVSVGWSIWQKYQAKKKVEIAAATGDAELAK